MVKVHSTQSSEATGFIACLFPDLCMPGDIGSYQQHRAMIQDILQLE